MGGMILLIGGGGHCHSVLDSVLSSEEYDEIGIVAKDNDNYIELTKDILIARFLKGVDADLPALFSQGWKNAFITLGSIGNPSGRIRICNDLERHGFEIPVIVDKAAAVSGFAELCSGAFVGKNAIVNAGSYIDKCSIVNSGAIVEHDCIIGAFSHISPGAIVCGNVMIGANSHIGAGTVVRQGIKIGENVLIGVGSVVVKDIPDNVKAFGNPCRVVE